MEEYNKEEMFSLNLKAISQSKTVSSIVCMLAKTLMDNPYITVGQYLQSLSEPDLKSLVEMCDDTLEHKKFNENILLISAMLAHAEGLDIEFSADQMGDYYNSMLTYLPLESLKRKGFVKLHYENMSFGPEFDDKIVVERI
jgi:hypothetical protein